MTDRTSLHGARVLILEDDYYLATDLQEALEAAGVVVIGPFSDEALAATALVEEHPDCALVDVNLGTGPSFDLPRALVRQDVPFAFVTGYDRRIIPDEFLSVERLEKPVEPRKVIEAAVRLMQRG